MPGPSSALASVSQDAAVVAPSASQTRPLVLFVSWFGIVGGAITLTGNSVGFLSLNHILRPLRDYWVAISSAVWERLLFMPKVPPLDAQLFNALSFILLNALICLQPAPPKRPVSRWATPAIPAFLVTIIYHSAFIRAFAEAQAVGQAQAQDGSLLFELSGVTGSALDALLMGFVLPFDPALASPGHEARWVASIFVYGTIALGTWALLSTGGMRRLFKFVASLVATIIVLYFIMAFISLAHRELGKDDLLGLALVMILGLVAVIAPVAILVWLLSHYSGRQFQFTTLSLRLWKIVAVVALLVLLDRSVLIFDAIDRRVAAGF